MNELEKGEPTLRPIKEMLEYHWGVLNGKISIPGLKIDDPFIFLAISLVFSSASYRELVEMGEIDSSMVFNLRTLGYDEGCFWFGDIGFKGDTTFTWNGKQWVFFHQKPLPLISDMELND